MSAEQPDNDVHEDMQLVLLQHIISGMNQSHQRQQISADKPDLQSDVMASLIQHLPGSAIKKFLDIFRKHDFASYSNCPSKQYHTAGSWDKVVRESNLVLALST